MMWDVVIPAWVALLEQDTILTDALGLDKDGLIPIYEASAARAVRIPSVEYLIFDDRETELFNPIRIQVDYWARELSRAAVIEKRIRLITHRDTSRVFELDDYEELRLWTRYLDSRTHAYTATEGVVHRSMDFLFEPVRARFFYT